MAPRPPRPPLGVLWDQLRDPLRQVARQPRGEPLLGQRHRPADVSARDRPRDPPRSPLAPTPVGHRARHRRVRHLLRGGLRVDRPGRPRGVIDRLARDDPDGRCLRLARDARAPDRVQHPDLRGDDRQCPNGQGLHLRVRPLQPRRCPDRAGSPLHRPALVRPPRHHARARITQHPRRRRRLPDPPRRRGQRRGAQAPPTDPGPPACDGRVGPGEHRLCGVPADHDQGVRRSMAPSTTPSRSSWRSLSSASPWARWRSLTSDSPSAPRSSSPQGVSSSSWGASRPRPRSTHRSSPTPQSTTARSSA